MASRSVERFPVLDNADVEIRLSQNPEDRLLLHSVVLGLHSSWFKASFAERWGAPEPHGDGPIKWKYELQFDSDATGGLFKQSLVSASAGTLSDGISGLYFNQDRSTSRQKTGEQLEKCKASVEAHRRFFSAMFHEPLHIRIADDPVGAFNALCYTIQVADFYNAIQILSTPTENLLNQLIPALGEYFTPALPALLNTSLKLELGWLFKDVICRLAGDHTRDDYQIRQGLDPVMASLVLQKRTSLRQMMKDVNYTLLTFKSLKYTKEKDAVATTAASACFREFIAFKVLDTDTRPWNEYAIIYRWLASTVETFDPFGLFRNYIFPKVASTKHAYDLFYSLHQDAARSIQPLLENCLSGPSPTEPNSDDQGFTCVRVDDGDLPWNKP